MRIVSIGIKDSQYYYIDHKEHVRAMRNDITFTYDTTYPDRPRKDFKDKWMKLYGS